MGWLRKRGSEPSTMGGLAALAQAAKAFVPEYAAVIDAASMLFGALAVAMSEKGKA